MELWFFAKSSEQMIYPEAQSLSGWSFWMIICTFFNPVKLLDQGIIFMLSSNLTSFVNSYHKPDLIGMRLLIVIPLSILKHQVKFSQTGYYEEAKQVL